MLYIVSGKIIMLNAKGIYAYRDIDTNQIVYVGLTTQSFNIRHKQHLVSKKNNLFENKLQIFIFYAFSTDFQWHYV